MRCILAALICLAAVNGYSSDDFLHGFSPAEIIDELGMPLREIETGRGALFFYGSVFLEFEDGALVFINVYSRADLERRRDADAAKGVYWGGAGPVQVVETRYDPTFSYRKLTPAEKEECLAQRRIAWERVVETRLRRFLLNRTFLTMMQARSFFEYPIGRWSGFGYAKNVSVSVLGLKDSRGIPVPFIGQDAGFVDRHIDFGETLMSADLAQATFR